MASSCIDASTVAQQLVDALAVARRMGSAPVVGLLTTDQVADLNDAAAAANLLLDGRADDAAQVIQEFQPMTTEEDISSGAVFGGWGHWWSCQHLPTSRGRRRGWRRREPDPSAGVLRRRPLWHWRRSGLTPWAPRRRGGHRLTTSSRRRPRPKRHP